MIAEVEAGLENNHSFHVACDTVNHESKLFLAFETLKPLAVHIPAWKLTATGLKNKFQLRCHDVRRMYGPLDFSQSRRLKNLQPLKLC